MSLVSSGAISLFDVNTELGLTRTSQIGMLCSSVRQLFGDASGAVAMFDGYGKASGGHALFTGTCSSCLCYSWTVPSGVTSISVLVVARGRNGSTGSMTQTHCSYYGAVTGTYYCGGNGGQGGYLAWRNNISVTPGQTFTLRVGTSSSFNWTYNGSAQPVNGNAAQMVGYSFGYTFAGTGSYGGYSGLNYNYGAGGAGGGAAGYDFYPYSTLCAAANAGTVHNGSSQGGVSGGQWSPGLQGSQTPLGGGGAPGCPGAYSGSSNYGAGGGGGGVGIYGRGTSGTFNGGLISGYPDYTKSHGYGGGGGSNGMNGGQGGACASKGGYGGCYGGGGGGGQGYPTPTLGGQGGAGAVRIIWPGCSRSFPITNVGVNP